MVHLDSRDFEIKPRRSSLKITSGAKAFFNISATHDGHSRLKATILKEANFQQQIEMTFPVNAEYAAAPATPLSQQ
jgi:hypothetical protein